jgi:hypothetical protein
MKPLLSTPTWKESVASARRPAREAGAELARLIFVAARPARHLRGAPTLAAHRRSTRPRDIIYVCDLLRGRLAATR